MIENRHFSIQSKGRILDLTNPVVMGILNITPDSFFEQSRVTNTALIVDRAGQMIEEGAKILDLGGMSTRPGAEEISLALELERLLPAIEAIRRYNHDIWLSVDTYRAEVAKLAIESGADVVNDISGGDLDDQMFTTIARLNCPYIVMHMKGTPKTMQASAQYTDLVAEVLQSLLKKVRELNKMNVLDVIVDPGFGFGKTMAHNFELLKKLHVFQLLDAPLLCGISRKSFIYKTLNIKANEALNGTTALHMAALQQGVNILRAHDVKEANEVIQLFLEL